MYFANDENGNRVFIDDAKTGSKYYCPACKAQMIMKCGDIVAHHFSHKASKLCDPWYTNKMSAWHRKLQNIFPKHCQEKMVWNAEHTAFHIADILFKYKDKTYVIELQHSSMSRREFEQRSKFYLDLGYRLMWIFDFCETNPPKKILYKEKNQEQEILSLIWPSSDRVKFLDNLDMREFVDEDEDQFHIFFNIFTGLGHEVEHFFPDGSSWYKWEYVNPFLRENLFVEPKYIAWESLREFVAFFYEEDEFYDFLSQYAKKAE